MSDADRPLTDIDLQRIRDAWQSGSGTRGFLTELARRYGLTIRQINLILTRVQWDKFREVDIDIARGRQLDMKKLLEKWNKTRVTR